MNIYSIYCIIFALFFFLYFPLLVACLTFIIFYHIFIFDLNFRSLLFFLSERLSGFYLHKFCNQLYFNILFILEEYTSVHI